ncbi:hypothetical protein FIE12Z_8809, partial [Fusarium flagelliforme]
VSNTAEAIPSNTATGLTDQPETTASTAPVAEAPEVSTGPGQSAEGPTEGPVNTQAADIGTAESISQPGQTEAAPSGFTTVTIPPPQLTGDVAELDLGDASLNNAKFTTVAGQEAIVLEPPPNGEAMFTIKVAEPLDIEEGDLVQLEAIVQVVESSTKRRKRFLIGRQNRGNRLQMLMNEKVIYDQEVDETAGKFQRIKSEKTQFVKNPVVQVLQTAGDNPVALSVSGLGFVKSSTPTKGPAKEPPAKEPPAEEPPAEEPPAEEPPAKEPPAEEPPAEEPPAEEPPAEEPPAEEPPAEEPATPPEATGEEAPPDNQETDEPAPEPTAPPEVSAEEPPPVGEETTVQPPQQTRPPDVVETESVPGTQETDTGIPPVIGTGTPTDSVPTTPTGPVEIRPNEGAHGIVTNVVALYVVPVLAALLV